MRALKFITGGPVIYNPAYTFKFQLKTTLVCFILAKEMHFPSTFSPLFLPQKTSLKHLRNKKSKGKFSVLELLENVFSFFALLNLLQIEKIVVNETLFLLSNSSTK